MQNMTVLHKTIGCQSIVRQHHHVSRSKLTYDSILYQWIYLAWCYSRLREWRSYPAFSKQGVVLDLARLRVFREYEKYSSAPQTTSNLTRPSTQTPIRADAIRSIFHQQSTSARHTWSSPHTSTSSMPK
jgi:hypothetical protein